MTKNITELESQKSKVEKLIQLIQQNPDLRILPMVDGELGGSDFAYYAGSFGHAEVDEVYYSDERIYFRSFDVERLEEEAFNRLESYVQMYNDDKQAASSTYYARIEEKARQEVNNLEWTKVIVVKIEMP